jgi:hypothetical protein
MRSFLSLDVPRWERNEVRVPVFFPAHPAARDCVAIHWEPFDELRANG